MVESSSTPSSAADDQRPLAAEADQRLGDRLLVVAVGDAEQLALGAGGVGQRPEEVEDRPHAERLAGRDDVGHRRVVARREHEPEPDLVDAAPDLLGRELDVDPERFEQVGRAAAARAERLPCLATAQPAPAATSAAVVETLKVDGPAAGPGGVDQVVARGRDRRRQRAHRPRQADQLGDRLPLRPQRDQEGRGLDLAAAPLHDLGEDRGGVVGGQVVAGADRVDRPGQDLVDAHARPRPFRA